MRNRVYFLCIISSLFFYNCNSTGKQSTATSQNATAETITLDITLRCIENGNDPAMPSNAVFLVINGKQLPLHEISSCQYIPKSDYSKYNIPKEAIDACGGMWADKGDYVYVKRENNYLFIMKAHQEAKEEALRYVLDKRIELAGI